MQTVRSAVLQHLRLRAAAPIAARGGGGGFARRMSAPAGQEDSSGSSSELERDIRTRVVNLVKKFDKIDADKVGSCVLPLLNVLFSPFPLPFFFACS
jgi:NADH dehydrogenase (ubiquinone) 1 alpha/beta subcomplex 1, acyl-carrier protein